ncbi:hypothetical protein [Halobiforma nitratireducens]|uniref:Uncharacterized protein n=1 Tax=Halobiforma nitratireducens JCM 10879 TaxID=1227454 RepID=M0LVK5_9EURY|nr:hypothetical protein [Halobiforma nitratireducens]EMA37602.1 hypothetical protein C446_10660 [Halobiforma nitratireducens JCM 10879]
MSDASRRGTSDPESNQAVPDEQGGHHEHAVRQYHEDDQPRDERPRDDANVLARAATARVFTNDSDSRQLRYGP